MSEVRVHLAKEIVADLWRHKLQIFLSVAVLVTAFAVILVTNMTRGLTAKQNDLMAEEDRLNIEWRHLLLEQGTLAEHSRVASLAMDKLQMGRPLVTTEKVITQPGNARLQPKLRKRMSKRHRSIRGAFARLRCLSASRLWV